MTRPIDPSPQVNPSNPAICQRCGRDHNGRCAGHLSSDKPDGRKAGDPCTNRPVHGADKCRMHGMAKGTRGRAAADKRYAEQLVERRLAKAVAEFGPVSDDVDALGILVARLAREAHVAGVADRLIDELATKPFTVDAEGRPVEPLYGPDHLGDLKPHPLIGIGQRWSDAAASHAKLALDAGVDARMLDLAEHQQAFMAEWMQAFVVEQARRFGLSAEVVAATQEILEATVPRAIEATSTDATERSA